jgi:hypothetical protein
MCVQAKESFMVLQHIARDGVAQRYVLPRRNFLKGLVGLIAAPAVVKAEALMPIKVCENYVEWTDLDELALLPRDPAWDTTPSFPILRSEDPSEWSESDWRVAEAEAALPPYHRTRAGELYLALRGRLFVEGVMTDINISSNLSDKQITEIMSQIAHSCTDL